MPVSREYCEAHGLTAEKIADTMIDWYRRVDAMCDAVVARLREAGLALQCRAGCCGCCRDDLSVTKAEAAVIRRMFPDIGCEKPHDVGKCPFLDDDGLCRIYAARPYICRTHGLPMRCVLSAEEAAELGYDAADDAEGVELRDICEVNAEDLDVMELGEEMMLTQGIAEAQLAMMNECAFGDDERISMRDFFKEGLHNWPSVHLSVFHS